MLGKALDIEITIYDKWYRVYVPSLDIAKMSKIDKVMLKPFNRVVDAKKFLNMEVSAAIQNAMQLTDVPVFFNWNVRLEYIGVKIPAEQLYRFPNAALENINDGFRDVALDIRYIKRKQDYGYDLIVYYKDINGFFLLYDSVCISKSEIDITTEIENIVRV